MATIDSKADYFKLCERGSFGNTLRLWGSLDEIIEQGYEGFLTARVKRATGGGFVKYNVKGPKEALEVQNLWISQGISLPDIYFNESAPDEILVTQGEIMRSKDYYDLFYCEEKMKMRDAMRIGKSMCGVLAHIYIKTVMTPNSYNDLMELFEIYPHSVIEFSVYEQCLGKLNGRNTLIWEVRNY